MSDGPVLDNTPRMRRIVQTVDDLRKGELIGCRLLDLGCAHGAYTLEFARRGAITLGVEGRQSWIDSANAWKAGAGLSNADFVHDDARNVDINAYGAFDVVLCLGLLYHLSAVDAVAMLRTLRAMCKDFLIVDTQVAMEPAETITIDGAHYAGWTYREHADDASPEQKAATVGASLDESFSFWFTRASLLNALKDAGFSSVMEVRSPLDNMYLGEDLKIHEDVVTYVAFPGTSVGDIVFGGVNGREVERWPESLDDHILQRPWTRTRQTPKPETAETPQLPVKGRKLAWRRAIDRLIQT